MYRRATDVIGRPIVSAVSGKKLGVVADLLIDESGRELLGLAVKHGALKGEDVLPIASVQSLGTDAVVSQSDELVDAKSWRHQHPTR